MAIQTARFKPGANLPGYANAASIVAGRFVKVVATKTSEGDYAIGPCGAGEVALGVAETSADHTLHSSATGRRCNVLTGGVVRVTVSGDITAGDKVASGAAGVAVTFTTGQPMGIALNTAADGGIVEVLLDKPTSIAAAGTGNAYAQGTQVAAIADETAITGGQDPTEAEFNALLVKFNLVLAALREYGIVASS